MAKKKPVLTVRVEIVKTFEVPVTSKWPKECWTNWSEARKNLAKGLTEYASIEELGYDPVIETEVFIDDEFIDMIDLDEDFDEG